MLPCAKLHLSHHHATHHLPPPLPQATLLYGVLCIQRDFPGQAAVPLDTLREACRALHAEAAVAAALPRIRSQFASLEAEVGGFLDENATGSGAQVRRAGLQASCRLWALGVVLWPGAAGGQGWCPLPWLPTAPTCCQPLLPAGRAVGEGKPARGHQNRGGNPQQLQHHCRSTSAPPCTPSHRQLPAARQHCGGGSRSWPHAAATPAAQAASHLP